MNQRRTDKGNKTYFKTDRFFRQAGQWYFYTREGTLEGPFSDQGEAKRRLDTYIKVTNSGMLGENRDADKDWKLTPKA